MQDFVEFLVLRSGSDAPDCNDAFHFGIEQAFAQDALSYHAVAPRRIAFMRKRF